MPSKSAALKENNHQFDNSDDEEGATVASVLATSTSTSNRSGNNVTAQLDGIVAQALLDTGSDISFVSKSFIEEHGLKLNNPPSPELPNIKLANNSTACVLGEFTGTLVLGKESYSAKFAVMERLVSPIIIGMNILKLHSNIHLELPGHRPTATFKLSALQTMKSQPYSIVPGVDTQKLKPLTTPPQRLIRHEDFIKNEIQLWLQEGIIQESQSPWRAQCFVANYRTKPRLVIDYSQTINKYTPLDSYPIPRIDDLLQKVAKHKFFSRIDLKSAYHQIPLKPEDRTLTAFQACGKLYEFTRLPFGLTNAVQIFQRNMDNFIQNNRLQETYAYLDDVIICGDNKEDHDKNLQAFLDAAETHKMTLNKSKCQFSLNKISFLGYELSDGLLRPDPSRFSSLKDFPNPTTRKAVERLLGFFAYYAKWIPKSSDHVQIIAAEKETVNQRGTLSKEAIAAINKLKDLLQNACLAAPRGDTPLTLETDASGTALGGTLLQEGRPIAFLSRILSKSERNQSVIEREACAIVECCRKWRHLLHAAPHFNIVTDQEAVSFLFNSKPLSKIKSEKVARWRLELSEFRFYIQYRPGPYNQAADALSRCAAAHNLQDLSVLHSQLCHPGVTRLHHYVKVRNLPFSVEDVRSVIKACNVCSELKPAFCRPQRGQLIHATRSWERISIDFVGPLPTKSQNKFLLVIVDEYSRFPFAFPCSHITAAVVIKHLRNLFALFGTPAAIHADRSTQFESTE